MNTAAEKTVVVVESPAKANTIKKYLGEHFDVLASYGHVRDLVAKEGAVETENGFAMRYEPIERNEKHVRAISKALKGAHHLYLATDPDREGEAIAWHLWKLLEERGDLRDKSVRRVVFNEITKAAVTRAVEQPGDISLELVNAQQARRALDYLVGFNISPLLWRKIRPGLSAGRVQSPALRLIVEREGEIERFEPREYWTIDALLEQDSQSFPARLVRLDGEKVEQFSIVDEERATAVRTAIETAAGETLGELTGTVPVDGEEPPIGALRVASVSRKSRKRHPAAPFITSTLQQEASRKLGFSAQRTMRIAQQLYEGVESMGEAGGLITYMRTDSVNLAQEALHDIRGVIRDRFGAQMVPEQPRSYRTKAKNAQEAHEAIRPTMAARHPDTLKAHLGNDHLRLYQLIWQRAVASQMISATIDTVAVELETGAGQVFRATGSTVADPGFLALYREGSDTREEEPGILPELEEGALIPLRAVKADQHFTEPPPRYTEASLIKTLEEFGIGRPSTYASIIGTLLDRGYAELENRSFRPTDTGRVVSYFLTEHFARYVDYEFTARLEDDLDAVSRGEREWTPLLEVFWADLSKQVEDKQQISRREASQARELGVDPESGKPVFVRMGRYGPYVQIGTGEEEEDEKPRFAGLRPGQRMDSIGLEEALILFQLPRDLGTTPEGEPLSANIGRFGPYVKYGKKYASLKEDDPYTITPERALEVVQAKQQVDREKQIKVFDGTGIEILNGRYGPYITNGKKNAKVPKETDPTSISLESAEKMLAEAPERKRRARGGRKAKTASR